MSDGFSRQLYQNFKEFMSVLIKLFYNIETEGALTNLFYEVSVTQIPKPLNDATKKENYSSFFLCEHVCKNSQQNKLAN